MHAKKVFSAFSKNKSLDFNLFEKLLKSSVDFQNDLLDLSLHSLDLVIKSLLDTNRSKALAHLVEFLDSKEAPYRTETLLLGLARHKFFEDQNNISTRMPLLKNLNKDSAYVLYPYIDSFPEKTKNSIEASIAAKRQKVEAFREDLKDQIEFLKSEQLTEKAIEIEDKLKFHFPKVQQKFLSKEHAEIKSKELSFSKLIERNIPFNPKKNEYKKEVSANHLKLMKAEQAASLELAEAWYSDLKDKDLDLLLTQLEFIDFDQPDFYLKILKEQKLDIWTSLFLYMKSEHYLEGLQFLDENESNILTESADSIYNYYYTKGTFLLGAGMTKEAEEIFTIIKNQKENFRDIQILLKKS